MVYGEDFENDRMMIGIKDLKHWIDQGANVKIKLTKEEKELVIKYLKNAVDVEKSE